jgi:hypothetical protein
MRTVADDPRFKKFFEDMDHTDVKRITADVSLRQFIAGMLSYHPWWLAMLFRLREVLVNLLGLVKHDLPARPAVLSADAISFVPGDESLFFIVREAEEDRFWVAETPPDNHLMAYLGVVARRIEAGMTQFRVFTTVRYLNWTGPVYFNLIRPFHHLVVSRMMRAATTSSKRGGNMSSTKGSDGHLIDRFSLKERLLSRGAWYGFMAVGTWGIFIQAPLWAVIYLLYSLAAFTLVILPGLCAHCPYPSEYSTCLFLPPAVVNRFFPYKGPQMHPVNKVLAFVAMAGIVMMPQFWLITDLPRLLLFWLLALPILVAFPRHFCRHCRHLDCPMNRASS